MKLIPLTQGQFAIVDDEDADYINQWKWHADKGGNTFYARRTDRSVKPRKNIRMHRVILERKLGRPIAEGMVVDHISGVGINNKRANLREVTYQQNKFNGKRNRDGSSLYKGVSWHNKNKQWIAQISNGKKNEFLGSFKTEKDAGVAYNYAAKKYYGEFSCFNEIPNWENITPTRFERSTIPSTRNKSGYIGVFYHKIRKKWVALVTTNGKTKYLGSFRTLSEAVEARRKAMEKIKKDQIEVTPKIEAIPVTRKRKL